MIDGDTIDVGRTRIRVHGVDSPETGQTCDWQRRLETPCGHWVTDRVRQRFEGQFAHCIPNGDTTYGRKVARCTIDGADLGAWLVSAGLALAYREFSLDYVPQEDAARRASAGLHSFAFAAPGAFRQQRRAPGRSAPAPEGCEIKGNVSHGDGTRIYHLPGQASYNRTVIAAARGERWFCSEAAARQAGWRPAKR